MIGSAPKDEPLPDARRLEKKENVGNQDFRAGAEKTVGHCGIKRPLAGTLMHYAWRIPQPSLARADAYAGIALARTPGPGNTRWRI